MNSTETMVHKCIAELLNTLTHCVMQSCKTWLLLRIPNLTSHIFLSSVRLELIICATIELGIRHETDLSFTNVDDHWPQPDLCEWMYMLGLQWPMHSGQFYRQQVAFGFVIHFFPPNAVSTSNSKLKKIQFGFNVTFFYLFFVVHYFWSKISRNKFPICEEDLLKDLKPIGMNYFDYWPSVGPP